MATIGSMQPDFVHTFVVFDSGSGAVAHIHQVVRFHGCHHRSMQDMEAEALQRARSKTAAGMKAADQLEVLSADGRVEPGASYRVDCKTRELIVVQPSSHTVTSEEHER